jgi:uncharacterized protein DUF3443
MRRLIAPVPLAMLVMVAACGGGGGGGGGGPPPPVSNVTPITVDSGPAKNNVNTAYISVQVCSPSSPGTCVTFDHIEVDTGSYGLRIIASVLPASFALPPEMDASNNAIFECAVFGDGFAWGSVAVANIQIAGETASSMPVQIIGDAVSGTPPTSCSSRGTVNENSVAIFGANGIIGVGPFATDNQFYYSCPNGVCGSIDPLNGALQVSNPVAFFATDNNGVLVELPSVADSGATSLTGSLVFGVGTQSNNGLGTAVIYGVDPTDGDLTITYKGTAYNSSFIDSGSNANFFSDTTIPTCSGFYCPTATLPLTALVTGFNGVSNTVDFKVANANDLVTNNPNGVAFNDLAAPNTFGNFFDFGLPFFFGRNVYVAIDGQATPAGTGPYVAF